MAKKQVIRLTESDLHRIIKESVNKVLNEVTVRTGSHQSFRYDPVPYDDDWIERYGNHPAYSADEPAEKNNITSHLYALVNRIEKCLEKKGLPARVDVSEDFIESDNQDSYSSYYIATLRVNPYYWNKRMVNSKTLSYVSKILDASDIVTSFKVESLNNGSFDFKLHLSDRAIANGRVLDKKDVEKFIQNPLFDLR